MTPHQRRVGVLDGHNDFPWRMHEQFDHDLGRIDFAAGVPELHTDLPRLRAGGVIAQFWSVFVPGSLTGQDAVAATRAQVDFVQQLVAAYPDDLALCRTAAEVEEAVGSGLIASMMGMEGGHSIDGSLDVLREMHDRGVRYMTLTHNENVSWADSATDVPAIGGLSDFGRDVVREMNRLGMFVDLSHVSDGVMRDALAVSEAPVLFSHSSARSVAGHPRNVPDDVLAELARNGGVCMVSPVSFFVSQKWVDWYFACLDVVEERGGDPRRFADIDPVLGERIDSAPAAPTVGELADHVDHVREVAGVGHIGLGGDYDGTSHLPAGMEDVTGYPLVFEELRSRGYTEAELDAIGSGNVLRAMRDMESAAR